LWPLLMGLRGAGVFAFGAMPPLCPMTALHMHHSDDESPGFFRSER
jgi:hypothetical protein